MMRDRLPELLALSKDALRWWLGELRTIAGSFGLGRSAVALFRIEIAEGKLRVLRRTGTTWFDIEAHAIDGTALPGQLDVSDSVRGRCEFVLPPSRALRRNLELPVALERDLRSSLELQLERLMPYESSRVYFDYEIAGRLSDRAKLAVSLVIVERCYVDECIALAQHAGLAPVSVSIRTPSGRIGTFHLRPVRPQASQDRRRARWASAAGATLLAAAGFWFDDWSDARLDSARAELEAVRAEARDARGIQAGLQALHERAEYLAGRLERTATATILSELTVRLPDDAWIYEMQLDGSRIGLRGLAADASTLSEPLENSPVFASVVLRQASRRPAAEGSVEEFALELTLVESGR